MEKCDSCGDNGAEYMLDDRHLCFDCYKLEKRLAHAEWIRTT